MSTSKELYYEDSMLRQDYNETFDLYIPKTVVVEVQIPIEDIPECMKGIENLPFVTLEYMKLLIEFKEKEDLEKLFFKDSREWFRKTEARSIAKFVEQGGDIRVG